MNHILPRVTISSLAIVCFIDLVHAQSPHESSAGQQMVAQAASQLAQQPFVEAELRQRVEVFGRFLVGSGIYRQLTVGPHQRMFRLEIKLQVADRLTSLLQVSDGTTLWIRRGVGDEVDLSYVNLGKVRKAMQASSQPTAGSPADQLAAGGLHQLLDGLSNCFDFGPPQPGHIENQPVWRLSGYWKPEKLAQLVPNQQLARGKPPDPDKLPAHLPNVVSLVLGRDHDIPLFPYQIEYGRLSADKAVRAGSGRSTNYRAIATLQLFGVRKYLDLDPHDFTFTPVDEQVADRTEAFLRRLGADKDRLADASRATGAGISEQ